MTARFRETGKGSFWADYVYEQVVPKNHFLTLVQHALARFLANDRVDVQTVQIALLPHTMARPKIPGRLRLNHLLMALTVAVCWLCLLADPEVGVLPVNWNAAVVTWGQASPILQPLVFPDDCLSLPPPPLTNRALGVRQAGDLC